MQFALVSAKKGKTLGENGIPIEVLHNDRCLSYLANLFNVCFEEGHIPDAWTRGTIYMLVHRNRITTDNLKLTIGQGTLKQTPRCKYRGLIIDNKFNCAAHIAHVKSKISKCVDILIEARLCLSRKCLLDIYYSIA